MNEYLTLTSTLKFHTKKAGFSFSHLLAFRHFNTIAQNGTSNDKD
jgi:hypothetical protein